jgi:hypothetical protein
LSLSSCSYQLALIGVAPHPQPAFPSERLKSENQGLPRPSSILPKARSPSLAFFQRRSVSYLLQGGIRPTHTGKQEGRTLSRQPGGVGSKARIACMCVAYVCASVCLHVCMSACLYDSMSACMCVMYASLCVCVMRACVCHVHQRCALIMHVSKSFYLRGRSCMPACQCICSISRVVSKSLGEKGMNDLGTRYA